MKLGNTELHLHVEPNPQPHPTNHFAIEVEDLGRLAGQPAGRRNRLCPGPGAPSLNDSGKLAGFLHDPDGNIIEVMYHAEWH